MQQYSSEIVDENGSEEDEKQEESESSMESSDESYYSEDNDGYTCTSMNYESMLYHDDVAKSRKKVKSTIKKEKWPGVVKRTENY